MAVTSARSRLDRADPPIWIVPESKKPPNKMAVIAPDQWSGELYHSVLLAKKVDADLHIVQIAPRVLGDRTNPGPEVARDLAQAITQIHRQGYRQYSIACNTLHHWIGDALRQIPEVAGEMNLVHNIEVMCDRYCSSASKPTWLGTTVSCRHTDLVKEEFPTLDSQGQSGLQDLTQRVIWDAKAGKFDQVPELVSQLRANGITHIVAGCTELPGAFASVPSHGLKIDDVAAFVGEAATGGFSYA